MRFNLIFLAIVLASTMTISACADKGRSLKVQIEDSPPYLAEDTTLIITYDNSCGDRSELLENFDFLQSKSQSLVGEQTYQARLRKALRTSTIEKLAEENKCVVLIATPSEITEGPTPNPLRALTPPKTSAPALATPVFTGFNDPALRQQTSLNTINASTAYKILWSGSRALKSTVTIGLIDRGRINADHPDLQGQLLPGSDTTTARREVDHGQYVLGIMAARANNGIGTAGIAGLNTKFLFKTLPIQKKIAGGGIVDMAQIANTIRSMGANGIDVINLSLGVQRNCQKKPGKCAQPLVADPSVLRAIKDTVTKYDTLFVLSAGNDSEPVPAYTTASDGVLVVGAIDASGRRSSYSNYGKGVNLSSTDSGVFGLSFNSYANNEDIENGTSFTAPQVAAAAALIKSYLRQNETPISAARLAALIVRNAQSSKGALMLDFGRCAQEAQKVQGAVR